MRVTVPSSARDRQIFPAISRLKQSPPFCEGVSVRATERLTGVNRGTLLSLGVRVGDGCAVLHDAMMRGLHVSRLELDEAWSFVAKNSDTLSRPIPLTSGTHTCS
jgi:hypothetical protein